MPFGGHVVTTFGGSLGQLDFPLAELLNDPRKDTKQHEGMLSFVPLRVMRVDRFSHESPEYL